MVDAYSLGVYTKPSRNGAADVDAEDFGMNLHEIRLYDTSTGGARTIGLGDLNRMIEYCERTKQAVPTKVDKIADILGLLASVSEVLVVIGDDGQVETLDRVGGSWLKWRDKYQASGNGGRLASKKAGSKVHRKPSASKADGAAQATETDPSATEPAALYLYDTRKREAIGIDREIAGWYMANSKVSRKRLVRRIGDRLEILEPWDLEWVATEDRSIKGAVEAYRQGTPF